MAKIKISVITTVLNEEDTIHALLESLLNQSRLPDEIVVVDAGSTDQTLQLIKEHQDLTPIPLKVILAPGKNRSQGRNLAIESAKFDNIAVIDAGCEAEHDWLKHLESGFIEGNDAVAGYYLPSIDKPDQNLMVPFLAVAPNQINANFLPSSRSLGVTKNAWKLVGKYPEYLPTCEDLVFAKRLKNQTSMVIKTEAIVYWHLPRSLNDFFNRVASYATGDMMAGYRDHVLKIGSMWLRYISFLFLPWLWLLYVGYRMWRHQVKVNYWLNYVLVMTVADMGVLWGSVLGLMRR